jgi:hypothetical protein
MPEFQPRYPGHEPLPYRDELDRLMEARFDRPAEERDYATTPFAPPPVDERQQDFRHSLRTEAPTRKARPGFVVNGFGQKKAKRDAKKRGVAA